MMSLANDFGFFQPHDVRWVWNVYLERADDDEPKTFIGTIEAVYEGQALHLASQMYEVASYDLVVIRSDLDTH